ncbi:Hypothetical protein CINCED_3A015370 [Cinara cedri]|uniref:Uncharacterized protein n=1 Tax=Cinara cedri TaxID=506608 RepID=A0A5E4NFG6_9HEMI|nr:Hypothetical protein CINCED_3A015370 [Cinara cedri]
MIITKLYLAIYIKLIKNIFFVEQAAPLKSKVLNQMESINPQIDQQIGILRNRLVIPKRKNPKMGGTLGRHTEVEVNYLPLDLDKMFKKTIYHIDCQFNPELPKRLLRTALEKFVDKHYHGTLFAFDGRRNMYTTKDLKGKAGLITVLNEEDGKSVDFTIVTSVVNHINMAKIQEYLKTGSSNCPPGEAFQALDIILKNRPFSLRFTNVERSFFPVQSMTPPDLGEGMELWKGISQSPVMGWKPYLNIDVVHRGFPKHQSLTSYIQNELNSRLDTELDSRTLNALLSYVKGLKVDFMVPNQPNTKRSYKVGGLLDTATKHIFEVNDGNNAIETKFKILSVFQYYKIKRNYIIKYPNLPCLQVGNKITAVPIELCNVQKGQLQMRKLTENQSAQMIKNAVRPPKERQHTIEKCINDMKYNQDPVLREFGINVQEKFACIPARILDQPSLTYFQNKETKPIAGIWKSDKFSKSVKLTRWIVLNLDSHTYASSIKNFEVLLMQSGRELNVPVNPMDSIHNLSFSKFENVDIIEREITTVLKKLMAKNIPPIELIVVIIPDYPIGIYAAVKQASELHVGILTQCIKSKTMFKMKISTTTSILMKINSKLNGINHTLSLKSSPSCMTGAIIFGADVTHPSLDQTDGPSIAAVTASHDLSGSQYNMEWRIQSSKVEIIQDLEDIVYKQLLKYKERTKIIPKKILYFRDGVSEGQFLQLLEYELIAIRRACLRLNLNYQPPITFLVVQKRHHTRIFPKHQIDKSGKFQNVPSGTVIDTQITHPTELDFYLCSHASIQGTSRPTKYHLIWDDSSFTEDEIEKLTFYLCFITARCTSSISYPAPTYYAHLAAFRARSYIANKTIKVSCLADEQVKHQLNAGFTVATPMFFI